MQSNPNYYFTNQLWHPHSFNRNMLEFALAIWVRNLMPWYKSKEKTHMLHGCQDYHWTPGHIGAVPLRSDRCCRCEWCRGIRFGWQKEPSPSPHNHGAGSQTPWSAKPRAPEAAPQSRSESCLTAWSQTAPQTERHFFSLTLFLDPALPVCLLPLDLLLLLLRRASKDGPSFLSLSPDSLTCTICVCLLNWHCWRSESLTSHMTPQLWLNAPCTLNLPLSCFSGSASWAFHFWPVVCLWLPFKIMITGDLTKGE